MGRRRKERRRRRRRRLDCERAKVKGSKDRGKGGKGKERMEDNRANTKMMKLTVLAGQVDGSGVHSPSSGAAVTRSLTERRERREERGRERRTRGDVRIGREEG